LSIHREQSIEAGGLRVRFAFQGDRFAHFVEVAQGGEWITLLASMEGSPLEDWPPGPPLQSIHLESRPPERQLALLVGMAGKSHWSASVELDPAGWVSFDVACRLRSAEPVRLGSAYRLLQPVGEKHDTRIVVADCSGHAILCVETWEPGGPARLQVDGEQIGILPTDMAVDSPRTVRWGYRMTRLA